jgi:GNAT superfamily N-acetyltransferase
MEPPSERGSRQEGLRLAATMSTLAARALSLRTEILSLRLARMRPTGSGGIWTVEGGDCAALETRLEDMVSHWSIPEGAAGERGLIHLRDSLTVLAEWQGSGVGEAGLRTRLAQAGREAGSLQDAAAEMLGEAQALSLHPEGAEAFLRSRATLQAREGGLGVMASIRLPDGGVSPSYVACSSKPFASRWETDDGAPTSVTARGEILWLPEREEWASSLWFVPFNMRVALVAHPSLGRALREQCLASTQAARGSGSRAWHISEGLAWTRLLRLS